MKQRLTLPSFAEGDQSQQDKGENSLRQHRGIAQSATQGSLIATKQDRKYVLLAALRELTDYNYFLFLGMRNESAILMCLLKQTLWVAYLW